MNDQYISVTVKICYNKHVRENDVCVFGWVSVKCHVSQMVIFAIIDQNVLLQSPISYGPYASIENGQWGQKIIKIDVGEIWQNFWRINAG